MASNKVLIKAYIHQLFGSPDIHMFEFDGEAGLDGLREEISSLVGGREVVLSWLDTAGDHIRLQTEKQLQFAVTHGVKDNVLRVSVRVNWLTADKKPLQQVTQDTPDATPADGEGEGEGEGGAVAEPQAAGAAAEAKPKTQEKFSGYVRTVGPDGVARERELTEEEAAYLLHRSQRSIDQQFNQMASLFGRPLGLHHQLPWGLEPAHHHHHHPLRSPYYLGW